MKSNKTAFGFWSSLSDLNTHIHVPKMEALLIGLAQKYKPNLIYDFGCGYGLYSKALSDATGVETIGFEGEPNTIFYSNILKANLAKPLSLDKQAEMVISLEVGEHIPKEFEQIFLDNIANNASNIVVLSWAVVGQGGNGHINCQNNDYIIKEMGKRGFWFNPKILKIRNIENLRWFKNSLMLFERIKK